MFCCLSVALNHFIFIAPLIEYSVKNVRNYNYSDLAPHSSANYTHTCLICVPRTVHLLMINITFWFMILKWRNFLLILIEWGSATASTIRRDAIKKKKLTNNPWVDQCAGYFYFNDCNFWRTRSILKKKKLTFLWKLIRLHKFSITFFFKIQNCFFFVKNYSKCCTFFRLALYRINWR